ncbi:hypothetical protein HKD37_17G048389 [Glycine soja]
MGEQNLMEEKKKKRLEKAAQFGSTDTIVDPSSPIKRYMKWKMANTKKSGQMTFETTKEIDSLEEKASQGSFVTHGHQDVRTDAIGRPEHPGRVHAAGTGITIKQYFGLASRSSHTPLSMAPKDLEQLTQKNQGPARGVDHTKSNSTINVVLQLNVVPDAIVDVKEVRDVDARVPVLTQEVQLVGQTLNTFYAWPTHLVKPFSEHDKQEVEEPVKPVDRSDPNVDPLYLMTLIIPQIFLKPLQVSWDANVHMTKASMQAGNAFMYGFLEPQFIQKSGQSQFESEDYIKKWMQNSQRDVYLGAYLNE